MTAVLFWMTMTPHVTKITIKQDNVQVNTESVQCISVAYSEMCIIEISEQLSRVDQSD